MAKRMVKAKGKAHEETISAVAHAALTLALGGLSVAEYESIFRLDVGDFERAAAAFVQHLLAQGPAPEPAA